MTRPWRLCDPTLTAMGLSRTRSKSSRLPLRVCVPGSSTSLRYHILIVCANCVWVSVCVCARCVYVFGLCFVCVLFVLCVCVYCVLSMYGV